MATKILRGTREFISTDGVKTKLEYYQKETYANADDIKTVHGIELIKYIIRDDAVYLDECVGIDALTESYEFLNYILGKLISGLVTPVSFSYVIDDLITEAYLA